MFMGMTQIQLYIIIALLIGIGGAYMKGRHDGYQVCDNVHQTVLENERRRQDEANRKANEAGRQAAIALADEARRSSERLEELDNEADADPNADAQCLSADSVRRLNSD